MIVFTVNEHRNICIAGLNRRAGYATAHDNFLYPNSAKFHQSWICFKFFLTKKDPCRLLFYTGARRSIRKISDIILLF